jgi:hypothetical protein
MPLSIWIPHVSLELTDPELHDLAAELHLLSPVGATLAAALHDATTGGGFELSDADRPTMARALDHLRNLRKIPSRSDLERLRDRLVSDFPAGIHYELSTGEIEARPFVSYTGFYAAGDRLIDGSGDAWRVVRALEPDSRTGDRELVVERED